MSVDAPAYPGRIAERWGNSRTLLPPGRRGEGHGKQSRRFLLPLGLLLGCAVIVGCQHQPYPGHKASLTEKADCAEIRNHVDVNDRIGTLRYIAHGFNAGCYDVVLDYGSRAQTDYRYKQFSILRETSSIFLPDGTLTEYVLESYERGFLTFLLSASHYQLDNRDGATIELRRLNHEIITPLYNYGEDPINILLGAVMWEALGRPDESRVDWNRLSTHTERHPPIADFASHRVRAIDGGEGVTESWTIYAIGDFPDVDWDLQFTGSKNGYFSVKPTQRFGESCASDTGIRISTLPWFSKIALRHSNGYHPILNAQSWMRLPFGVAYSITAFASGASIAIGGCVLDIYTKGDGALCEVSLNGGTALIMESPRVLRHTLQPDLRHWDNLPAGFLFTTVTDIEDEACFSSLSAYDKNRTKTFFTAKGGKEHESVTHGQSRGRY